MADTDNPADGTASTAHDGPAPASKKSSPRPSMRPGGPSALIGRMISDRYRIERLIGEGGMGCVYQAEHTQLRKRMAIKVLHPEMTRVSEVVQRFEREAMAAAHIDHPHVVAASDFGKLEDGSFFLALEFVEGKSLREIIGQGRLELGRSLHIATQIASALGRAHTLKIVHRDLKPENVMLVFRNDDPDFVKVLDFGIAKVSIGELADSGPSDPKQPILTQAGMVYGTPEYMAPEQALGQPVDARADLYALGVIMFEMICGVRPFDADSKVALLGMQVTAPVPKMADKTPDLSVPPEVEGLIGRLLMKEATERLADAKELIDGIAQILTQLAAAGKIDAAYAPSPASGLLTNPGLISAITPAPADLLKSQQKDKDGPFAGKGWLVAAIAGVFFIAIIATTSFLVLGHKDTVVTGDADTVVTNADAGPVLSDATLDEKVKEGIAMIDRGDYASGIKRLEDLGPEVEGREDVHRALFNGYSSTDHTKEALREARLWLKANPNLDITKEEKLRLEIRDSALKYGSADATLKTLANDAFALLEGSTGTAGWDDVYDIAFGTPSVNYKESAARGKSDLAKASHAKMSPALAVTLDLWAATGNTGTASCAVKQHFDRAAEVGDERTLFLLKQWTEPVWRGNHYRKTDLLGCIHDGSLKKTIAAIEERVKATKKK